MVITAYTKDRTWTSEGERYGYSGYSDQYQKDNPEFAGMSDAQMMIHWTNNYSSDWNKQVTQWDQEERDRILMEKLYIFKEGFITAGAMGMGAMGNTSLASPKTFSYTPRYQGVSLSEPVPVHGNSLNSLRPTWGYKLYSNDGTFLKNGINKSR